MQGESIKLWVITKQRQLALLAIVICALLILAATVTQINAIKQLPSAAWSPAVVSKKQNNSVDKPLVSVASWSLFGRAGQENDFIKSSQYYKLHGVLSGKNGKNDSAVISFKSNPEKIYGVGDPLPDGSSVYKVYPDKVIIQRGAAFEALYLRWER